MGMRLEQSGRGAINPLDLLEELASVHGWPHVRAAEDEFVTEPSRRWCAYRLHFIWQADMQALHIHCGMDVKVPGEKRRDINQFFQLFRPGRELPTG